MTTFEARDNAGRLIHSHGLSTELLENVEQAKAVIARSFDILLQECWNKGVKPSELSFTIKPEPQRAEGLVPVGSLPQDSSFEYYGKITSRGGIACFNEDGCFGLDLDTMVKPRPDIDANVVRVGGGEVEKELQTLGAGDVGALPFRV